MMHSFSATIEIIGVNPYVEIPEDILQSLFDSAKKSSGPIPVKGTLNGHTFIQTLVNIKGHGDCT